MRFLARCTFRVAFITILSALASEAAAQCTYGYISGATPETQLCGGDNPNQTRFTTKNFSMQGQVQCRDGSYFGAYFDVEQASANAIGECGRALANETPGVLRHDRAGAGDGALE